MLAHQSWSAVLKIQDSSPNRRPLEETKRSKASIEVKRGATCFRNGSAKT